MKQRITVSLDTDLVAALRTRGGRISSYVNAAVRQALEEDTRRAALLEWLGQLDAQHGETGPQARTAADALLDALEHGEPVPGEFSRITTGPGRLGGKPCIRGLRISVETVVRLVAAGRSFDEILAGYPGLEPEDIRQALGYAAVTAGARPRRPGPGPETAATPSA